MTRQLSEILDSGEITSINKAGTDPGNAVLSSDEITTKTTTQLSDGSVTDIHKGGATTDEEVLTRAETTTHLQDLYTMFYAEDYVEGATYTKGKVVKYGNWLSIYTTESDAHPAPETTGPVESVYSDDTNMTDVPITAAYLLFGMRYTAQDIGFLVGFEVNVVAGNSYVIYYNENPGAQSTLKTLVTVLSAQHSGWQTFTFHPKLYPAGTVLDVVVSCREVDPVPTVYTANYDYQIPATFSAPLDGQIIHAKNDPNIMYIAKIDNDAIDQYQSGYALYDLGIGSHISIGGMKWAVQGVTDSGTYLTIYVAPGVRVSTAGVYNCSFEDPNTTTLTYHEETGIYAGNANIRGLFIADGNYTNIVENDNQYGVNILFQPAYMTDDCEILAYTGGDLLTAGSGASLQEQINAINETLDQLLSVTYETATNLGPVLSLAEIQAIVPVDHPSRFLVKDPSNTWIVIFDGTNYYSTQMVLAT